ncbi:MAG: membrane dipeptidase [Oligoflexia bacterium]|nr:membrane dipeptidase [Oligoflexia bacterium]
MRTSIRTLLATVTILAHAGVTHAAAPIVDLHAHLFFYEGTGVSFFGSFSSPVLTDSSSSRLGAKANAQALENSGARIIIVALYAHPLFWSTCRDSIRKQIDAAEAFVTAHPDWAIARSAEEAARLVHAGKRILILSIEGASCVLETEEDLNEFIDRRGVRIVTPVHFTDDTIGGASFMPGIEILTNPIAALESLIAPHFDQFGARVHSYGLGKKGQWLVESLLKRGIWIDLAHTSDGTYSALTPWLERAKQPFLYTHTILRRYYRAERGVTPERLEKVRDTGGIVGLLPSEDMLAETKADPVYCPTVCTGSCDQGIPIFLTQYSEMAGIVGDAQSVMIGSDINAPLNFLGAACSAQEKQGYHGLSQYGQLAELWQAMRNFDLVPRDPNAWTERFLAVWSKVKPLQAPAQISPTAPSTKSRPGSG